MLINIRYLFSLCCRSIYSINTEQVNSALDFAIIILNYNPQISKIIMEQNGLKPLNPACHADYELSITWFSRCFLNFARRAARKDNNI